MNEQYFEAEMDIVEFTCQDVINTSINAPEPPRGDTEGPAGDAFL